MKKIDSIVDDAYHLFYNTIEWRDAKIKNDLI